MPLWLVIVTRILANPFSNVFQKVLAARQASPLAIICVTHGLLSLLVLPICVRETSPTARGFWLNIAVCTVLAVLGNVLIVAALRRADLSALGPINAYKAVVSLLPGIVFLHEIPSRSGLLGIVLVVAGSYLLVDRAAGESQRRSLGRFLADRGVQCRLGALVVSAIEAVFLKRALADATPGVTFAYWAVLGFIVSLTSVAVLVPRGQRGQERTALLANAGTCLLLALSTGLMQLCTIITLGSMQVGYALALFQTSALVSVLLGHHLFREGHFYRRLAGSAVMVAGAALIVVTSL